MLRRLAERVNRCLNDRGVPSSLPGLRLEVHPALWCRIFTDPESLMAANIAPGLGSTTEQAAWFLGMPVKLTAELPKGTWRLVIVQETVLGRGGNEPLDIVAKDEP